jgi:hypothetical protein
VNLLDMEYIFCQKCAVHCHCLADYLIPVRNVRYFDMTLVKILDSWWLSRHGGRTPEKSARQAPCAAAEFPVLTERSQPFIIS